MRRRRLLGLGLGGAIATVVAACGGESSERTVVVPAPSPEPDYPDAVTRELQRQAARPRPVEPSAIPPRHLDEETFPVSLVERQMIVPGGPPVDGIGSIDDPEFELVADVDWLEPDEAVMVLEHDGQVRIHPARILVWHEIVNDVVGATPVAVTYCPLCNSGLAFVREVDGVPSEFGTSGSLYQSNLVMYDRLTESLWTQFDGRAVVGTSVGEQLERLPLSTVAWSDAAAAHPEALVLSLDTGFDRPYGRNPYNAYDRRDEPLPGFFVGEPDGTLVPFERVIGIEHDGEAVAVRRADALAEGVVSFELGGTPVTVWGLPGLRSPLNDASITAGDEIGAVAVFDARRGDDTLTFRRDGDSIVDEATGSRWNVLGEAESGPLAGERLTPVLHVDTFWFSWATFQVEPVLIRPDA